MKITTVTYYQCEHCLQQFTTAEECYEHMKTCVKRLSEVFDANNNLRDAEVCLNCAFANHKVGETYVLCSKKYDEVKKLANDLAGKPTSTVHYLVETNQVCDLYRKKGTGSVKNLFDCVKQTNDILFFSFFHP